MNVKCSINFPLAPSSHPCSIMISLLLSSPSVVSGYFLTPWTVAHQVPLSMQFPMQKHWCGLPFPSPGDLPDQGIKLVSPVLAGRFFTTEPLGKVQGRLWDCVNILFPIKLVPSILCTCDSWLGLHNHQLGGLQ